MYVGCQKFPALSVLWNLLPIFIQKSSIGKAGKTEVQISYSTTFFYSIQLIYSETLNFARASHSTGGSIGNSGNSSRGVTPHNDEDDLFMGSQGSHSSQQTSAAEMASRRPLSCLQCHQFGGNHPHQHHH